MRGMEVSVICFLLATFNHISSAAVSIHDPINLFSNGKNILQSLFNYGGTEEVQPSMINFYLYTHATPTEGLFISSVDFNGQINHANFDPTLPTLFLSHGWSRDYQSFTNTAVRDAIYATDTHMNIFFIDWAEPAKFFYTYAVQATPKIAEYVARFIQKLQSHYDIDGSTMVSLCGHSVGGQLVGIIGGTLNGNVRQIVSLDPVWPLFDTDDLSLRLDPSDGKHVEVYHTNVGLMASRTPLGHVDVYPNGGGMSQPGCGPDLFGICAHDRAVWLYVETITARNNAANNKYSSTALIGTKCDSYENFKQGKCEDNDRRYLGGIFLDKLASGEYYLDTAAASPFGQG